MVYWYVVVVGTVAAFPASWVDKSPGTKLQSNLENFISKYDPYPFDFDLSENILPIEDIEPITKNVQIIAKKNKTKNEKTSVIPLAEEFTEKPPITSESTNWNATNNNSSSPKTNNGTTAKTNTTLLTKGELDPVFDRNSTRSNETGRIPRQETFNETNISKEKESQEESSEEEEGNMITGLLSAFLGGLSRPDGSIDLEAIVGLLGSLSTQYPNGTYEFNGLTELLRGFFGGGDDGGGSDVGAFAGGLLGAVIKGLANPPGAKGAGIFTGKVVAGLLPALSGPAPAMDGNGGKKTPQLDAGGFLTGLLKPILGSSTGGGGGQRGSKFAIIKTVISLVTSLLSAASSLASSFSSKSDWAQSKTNWPQARITG